MKMKQHVRKLLLATGLFATLFTACKKDDTAPAAPSVTKVEIGHDNSKVAYAGTDFHVEAELFSPVSIDAVKLTIRPKTATGWTFEQEYKDGFAGLKNATFHKHIDVPADAALGSYELRLVVTDQEGRSTSIVSGLEIKFDPSLPAATGFEVGLNAAGNDLHVEAKISAVNKIAKMIVEIHGAGWEKEVTYTDEAAVGQTAYTLHKHIDVTAAPKGHYHVHLKVIDQQQKESEFEAHFDKP